MSVLNDWLSLVRELCADSCPGCEMQSVSGFCSACRREFVRIDSPCRRCGLPGWHRTCPGLATHWAIDAVRAPFAYAFPLTTYLQSLKYARQRRLGPALGELLVDGPACGDSEIDALVAVPLHPRRFRSRTFNQADEIARPVVRALGSPLLIAGIRRSWHTLPQTGRDRRDRLAGLRRAFAVSRDLHGLRLAIIDDVITTGATVNALATALKAAGAIRVEAWAVARTIDPEALER